MVVSLLTGESRDVAELSLMLWWFCMCEKF